MVKLMEFLDYKEYLKSLEQERSTFQRGFRSRLAETLACQKAYVSQVFNTHAHFSLEQGLKVSELLRHSENETRYFLLLVEFARAGTENLRTYFKSEIEKMREKNLDIKGRVRDAMTISVEQQNIYYSSWLYSAVQMMVSIQDYKTISQVSSGLGIEEKVISEIVLFLISIGILKEENGKLMPGVSQIHLGKDSTLIRTHHTNWRSAAMESLQKIHENEIHYSSVSSLSKSDVEKIKVKFVEVIEDYVRTVAPSKEETLYCFNLDFFSLVKNQ